MQGESGVQGAPAAPTRIASVRTIQKALIDAQTGGPAGPWSHQLTQLVAAVRELGADLHGTGRFAERVQSSVPLTFRMPARGTLSVTGRGIRRPADPGTPRRAG